MNCMAMSIHVGHELYGYVIHEGHELFGYVYSCRPCTVWLYDFMKAMKCMAK